MFWCGLCVAAAVGVKPKGAKVIYIRLVLQNSSPSLLFSTSFSYLLSILFVCSLSSSQLLTIPLLFVSVPSPPPTPVIFPVTFSPFTPFLLLYLVFLVCKPPSSSSSSSSFPSFLLTCCIFFHFLTSSASLLLFFPASWKRLGGWNVARFTIILGFILNPCVFVLWINEAISQVRVRLDCHVSLLHSLSHLHNPPTAP